jgi:hypothetical protein
MILQSCTGDGATELVLAVAHQGTTIDRQGAIVDCQSAATDYQHTDTSRQGAVVDHKGATTDCQGAITGDTRIFRQVQASRRIIALCPMFLYCPSQLYYLYLFFFGVPLPLLLYPRGARLQ